MRKLILLTATLSLALLAFVLPAAQDASADARAKALLAPFVGTWETTFSMPGMPDTGSKGQEVVTALPHGLALVIHSTSDMGPMGKYEGHGLLGFSPDSGKWSHAWTDSMTPGLSIDEGSWSGDGKSFVIQSEEDMGMGAGKQKVVMTMHVDDADHLTWTMRGADAAEGSPPLMTMKYTRKP